MPKGGLGNLIALPLQKEARKAQNSEFINRSFEPYPYQWAFLDTIRTLSEDDVITFTSELGQGNELGVLKRDEEDLLNMERAHWPDSVEYAEKGATALQETLEMLRNTGVNVVFRSSIHQKFALIDQRVVWYGSINLLSFGSAEESIMQLESSNIASELLKSLGKQEKR